MLIRLTVLFVLLGTATRIGAAPVLIAKDNYKSAADSPFDLAGGGHYLDDFEGGTIDAPGLNVTMAPALPWGAGGSSLVGPLDSATSIDPSGWSLSSEYVATRLDGYDFAEFHVEFDATALGGLPRDAGVVLTVAKGIPAWLDVGVDWPEVMFPGIGIDTTFSANRFVGVHADDGIKSLNLRLYVRSPGDPTFEIDHFQYGAIVPEPSTALLMALGCLLIASRRLRHRPSAARSVCPASLR